MNYEAMTHAELVELAKAQRELLDQQAELLNLNREVISALEREAELAGQVVQVQGDNAELRQQNVGACLEQVRALWREFTKDEVRAALLDGFEAAASAATALPIKKFNTMRANHRALLKNTPKPKGPKGRKAKPLPALFVARVTEDYGQKCDGIHRRQPNGPARKAVIQRALVWWEQLCTELGIPNQLPKIRADQYNPILLARIEQRYRRQVGR